MQPVEVPLPGASYNPDPEQHQDALAAAVAAELRKEAQQEASRALPQRRLEAPADPLAQLLDEGVALEDEQTSDEDEGSQRGQPTNPSEAWKSADGVGIGVVFQSGPFPPKHLTTPVEARKGVWPALLSCSVWGVFLRVGTPQMRRKGNWLHSLLRVRL